MTCMKPCRPADAAVLLAVNITSLLLLVTTTQFHHNIIIMYGTLESSPESSLDRLQYLCIDPLFLSLWEQALLTASCLRILLSVYMYIIMSV